MRPLLVAALLATSGAAAGAAAPDGGAPDVSRLPFTPDSVRAVMVHHTPEVQACYEETLAEKGKVVEGRLTTTFTITAEGLVKDAQVARRGTSLHEPRLHQCVVAVLSGLTFPRPPDGRDHPVEYPFNLKAVR